ncbi:aldo/keto reductase [Levilactobacillus brevis]|nr:aldo/keto reductase [Levilactobacillus brevis]
MCTKHTSLIRGRPLEETLTTLSGLIDAGKIRYYGVSNYSAQQLRNALTIIDQRHLHPFVSVQNRDNLLTTQASEPALTFAKNHQIGYLAYSPLARGVLTGKYLNGNIPAGSRLSQGEHMMQEYMNDSVNQKVTQFKQLADSANIPMAQLAFSWLLTRSGLTTTLFGASKLRYFDAYWRPLNSRFQLI